MLIDIYDYFDRWMINYIVYHHGHLQEYGDVEKATTYFNARYQNMKANMDISALESQMNTIQVNMRSKAQRAGGSLKILNELQRGNLLSQTLDEIANGLNQAMDSAGQQVNFDTYQWILQEAGQYSGMLASSPDARQIDDFFTLLIWALEQSKLIDINILQALSGISESLGGTNFSIDKNLSSQILGLTTQDAIASQKIIDALSKVTEKMNKDGIVSPRSFAMTINYIFQKVIGNKLQQLMLAEGLNHLVNQVDNEFNKIMNKPLSQGKLTWIDKGQRSPDTTKTFNTDVFNNGIFSLQVKKGKQFYDIEISTNTEIKWYKNMKSNTKIQTIGKANLETYFSYKLEKYLAYNIIAHRYSGPDFEEAFNAIKASTAASFFNDWVQNTGFQTSNGAKAQFLMINGKVYSVMRIISNICEDILKNEGSGAFQMDIPTSKIKNTWIGNGPNIQNALTRSKMVNEIINILTISATLNANILLKYAY